MLTSKMGIAQMAVGAAKAMVAGPLIAARMAKAPKIKPISMLPASPRKMLAGGLL